MKNFDSSFSSFECPTFNNTSPSQFLNFCQTFSSEPGTCLFFSGGDQEIARKTYLCLFPIEHIWVSGKDVYHLPPGLSIPICYSSENPWIQLKELISKGDPKALDIPDWVGYFGYEMGAFSDREVEKLYQASSIPDAYFLRPAVVFSADFRLKKFNLYLREDTTLLLNEAQKSKLKLFESFKERNFTEQRLSNELRSLEAIDSWGKYEANVKQAKEWILSGEIYQVNLSQKFKVKHAPSPFMVFEKLAHLNPAPFMGYFDFFDFQFVSSSPERFLCKKGNTLETRPIKGTAPRGKTEKEDQSNRFTLLNSVKERAELLMITDLMRNDLAMLSIPGSIVTEKIWHCESYTNIFHLNSLIRSKVSADLHPLEILKAVFPAGSITGCPKLRAMEAIYALEKRPRGIYTGSIGYFGLNGDFDFNVAIRTMLFQSHEMIFSLGGAIVSDSIAEKEYRETLYKGESIFKAINQEPTY